MKKRSLADSKKYREFIAERDQALELVHRNLQVDLSLILKEALKRAEQIIAHGYSTIPGEMFFTQHAILAIDRIQTDIRHVFTEAASKSAARLQRFRKHVYLLAYASEVEAISRATGKRLDASLKSHEIQRIALDKSVRGEDIHNRCQLAYSRILKDLMDAMETARVMEESLEQCLHRIRRAMPKSKSYVRPRRHLRPVREADVIQDDIKSGRLSTGFVDNAEWDDFITDFRSKYTPGRGPDDMTDEVYDWEIEREATHQFLADTFDAIRDGSEANGVTDFVWASVIDKVTDECCLWRDTLLVSEIETQLDEHAGEDEDCDLNSDSSEGRLAPPLHFNCRCRIYPAVGDLPDSPELTTQGDFESWMNS